jgi:hypothetical protein
MTERVGAEAALGQARRSLEQVAQELALDVSSVADPRLQ